jgi:hypothetical protein
LLPAFLMVFDKLICKTTSGMKMIFKKEEWGVWKCLEKQ